MINKLRKKFVALTAASLLLLLAVIVTGMNIINYSSVVSSIDRLLERLSYADMPISSEGIPPQNEADPHPDDGREPPTHFFFVLLSDEGDVISVKNGNSHKISDTDAGDLALSAASSSSDSGFIGNYRYLRTQKSSALLITFFDAERDLSSFYGFLNISIIMSVAGYCVVMLVMVFLSGKVISPIANSYEKQKRFITDAGHELKTPLTIISANADIIEMEYGPGECIDDIRDQTHRLADLTENLISLARMEEEVPPLFRSISVSEITETVATSFRAIELSKSIDFSCNIEPGLTMNGESAKIVQLVTLLLDNAMKYVPPQGNVTLTLEKQGRFIVLSVVNSVSGSLSKDSLKSVFERFYRTDLSRNSETGGQGIGLSIALAIVNAHGGKIRADAPGGNRFRITATLPHNL